MQRLRRRYGHASAASFKTATRKIEKMIIAIETGATEGSHDDALVFTAINKLEDRVYKTWRETGDDSQRTVQDAEVSALRARMRAAVDVGYQARQARRHGEIQAIKTTERERLANMSPSERALYNYQQELKLSRGR